MKSARYSALWPRVLAGALAAAIVSAALASSHREAPFITTRPKVDGTDFYMFNSYETGRTGFVTLIANYQGLQEPQAGPNYFTMDPNGLYEIHIDNTGDGVEDLTFQFRFSTVNQGLTVMAGTKSIPVPLSNIGPLNSHRLQRAERLRDLHAHASTRQPPHRHCHSRSPTPRAAARPSPSRSTTSARNPFPTTRRTPTASSTRSPFRVVVCRARSSSASGRTGSW